MRKNQDAFLPGCFYHVFNRSNNKERLFKQPRNYKYLLTKYDQYLSTYVKTYAYCLLRNHFHLLVKVNPFADFQHLYPNKDEQDLHKIIGKQFATLFGTYTKAINKQEGRYGNLFQRPYKRKQIENESHFSYLVYYIHANPQLHTPNVDFKTYKWSSYQTILSKSKTKIARDEVLAWFGGVNEFKEFHDVNHELKKMSWLIE